MEYAPDFSKYTPGQLLQANSFVPHVNGGYQTSAPPFLEGYAAVGADVIGAALVKTTAGTAKIYAGKTTKLYQANGTTGWTDRSGAASFSAVDVWTFAQFGDVTLAANGGDKIQSATTGNFADVADAPRAKFIMVHENAVIGLNILGNPDGWARSDTGDYTTFTATAGNDADSGDLTGGLGGALTGGAIWQNLAIAFKANAMYGGLFIGDVDEKIRWQVISPTYGCVGPFASIETEIGIIFVSPRDVLCFDGSKPRSIADKVRRTFFASTRHQKDRTFITHDEAERNIYFWFSVTANAWPTFAYVYNYRSSKWASAVPALDAAGSINYLRCPVIGANYTDYIAVGGTGSNSFGQANVAMFDNGTLANFAHQSSPTTRLNGPALLTGLMGEYTSDTAPTRFNVIQDDAGASVTAAASMAVTTYNAAGDSTSSSNAAMDAQGHGDSRVSDRYVQASPAWGLSTGRIVVKDILPDPKPAGKKGG